MRENDGGGREGVKRTSMPCPPPTPLRDHPAPQIPVTSTVAGEAPFTLGARFPDGEGLHKRLEGRQPREPVRPSEVVYCATRKPRLGWGESLPLGRSGRGPLAPTWPAGVLSPKGATRSPPPPRQKLEPNGKGRERSGSCFSYLQARPKRRSRYTVISPPPQHPSHEGLKAEWGTTEEPPPPPKLRLTPRPQ